MNPLGSIKKRRGRPPKYLSVWRSCSAGGNMKTEGMNLRQGPDENSIVLKQIPVDASSPITRSDSCDVRSDDSGVEVSPISLSGASNPFDKTDSPAKFECVSEEMGDDSTATDTPFSNPEFPTTPSPTSAERDKENNIGKVNETQNTMVSDMGKANDSGIVLTNELPGTPIGAPIRRRPGRPPGSTKRYKHPYSGPEYRKKGIDPSLTKAPDEFSLRKFFEAGGRDYNEYLEWLKSKKANPQSSIPLNQRQVIDNGSAFSPPMAMKDSQMAPMPFPALQFQQRGLMPPRGPTPTGQMAALRPMMPRIPVSNANMMQNVQMTRIPGFPFLPGVVAMPPMGMLSPPPREAETSVLDLSAKRPKVNDGEHYMEIKKFLGDENEQNCPENKERHSPKERINGSKQTSQTVPVESSTDADVLSWDIDHVVRFVSTIPGCQDYAETFRDHEIDGTTLLHLSEQHLLNVVKMKLGPAIRLKLAVDRLKSTK